MESSQAVYNIQYTVCFQHSSFGSVLQPKVTILVNFCLQSILSKVKPVQARAIYYPLFTSWRLKLFCHQYINRGIIFPCQRRYRVKYVQNFPNQSLHSYTIYLQTVHNQPHASSYPVILRPLPKSADLIFQKNQVFFTAKMPSYEILSCRRRQ